MFLYSYAPIRMAKIKNTDNTKLGKVLEQLKPLHIYDRNVMWYNQFAKVLLSHKIKYTSTPSPSSLIGVGQDEHVCPQWLI